MIDLRRLFGVMPSPVDRNADFQRLLEWRLLRGSHEFPGPDGGTCVNEAAIVVAGYPYRAVYSVRDLPASFSRPIAMLALCLNDTLGDELRQELLAPFVTRLAGSADAPGLEMVRARLIHERVVAEILEPALVRHGNATLVERCRALRTAADWAQLVAELCAGDYGRIPRSLVAALRHAAEAAAQAVCGQLTDCVFCTFLAVRDLAALDGSGRGTSVYRQAVKILEAAIAIGKQAEIDADMARGRMNRARRSAKALRGRAPLGA